MALLTRISVGGTGKTYGTITDKAEAVAGRPGDILTRIAVGGVGQTYSVTDKTEDAGDGRPGDLFTRIGVGGVGIYYAITDKAESDIPIEATARAKGGGYWPSKDIDLEEEEIIIMIVKKFLEVNG